MARKRKGMRSDGTFEFKTTIGKNIHGQRIQKSFYGSTLAEAKRKAEAYKAKKTIAMTLGDPFEKSRISFQDWAKRWLAVYKRPHLTSNSMQTTYKPEVERLIKHFGSARLCDIRQIDVQEFFNTEKYRSMSRLKKSHFILKDIFACAVENDLIYKNPVARIELSSTYNEVERTVLTDDQIPRFVQAAEDAGRDDALLLLLTGLRRGELLGLMWTDYNPDTATLAIRRAVSLSNNHPITVPPKWNSYRTLPLSPAAIAVIDRQPKVSNYIFPNKLGKVQQPNTWTQKYRRWKRTLPPDLQVNPHELRHTYGTKLRRDGVDIYTIQKLLGHKSIDVTTEIYVHAETDAMRSAVERVANNHEHSTNN